MTVEIGNFIRIHRDPMTETGLSALEGTSIETVDDLPEHLVEVHVFSDGTYAATFVEGIQLVGLGNSMALTRQTGSREVNQVVLIARFDQPRLDGATPVECLKVVHHARDFAADNAAQTAYMERHHQRQREDHARWLATAKSEGGPIADLLKAAGWEVSLGSHASDSSVQANRKPRGRFDRPNHVFGVTIPHQKGDITVRVSGYDLTQGNIDLLDRYREIAASHGATFGPEGEGDSDLVIVVPRDERGAAMAVGTLETCIEDCERAKSQAYEDAFRAGMKVTAARKRLFAGGREHGISAFVNRGSRKARAGGEEIGPSEITALLRMGWIEADGPRSFSVTDTALEAAGLARDPADDPERPVARRR